MSNSWKSWLGQVTTGHAFMLLAPTLMSAMSGTMSWSAAFPLLAASAIGLAWPENTGLKAAVQTTAADLEKVYAAYQGKVVAATSNAPLPPDPRMTGASVAVLAAIGLSLAACAGQTQAQQTAEIRAVECIADTAAKIAATAAEPTTAVAEAAHAATAIGTALTTDPACAAAPVSEPAPTKP